MVISDLALSRRLERAEGRACVQYAEARRGLFPASGVEWSECAGAYAVFDGTDSPVSQSFGLGLFEDLTADALDRIECFFFDRGAAAEHEVSPLAGSAALSMLCGRSYRPIEISNVLYQQLEKSEVAEQQDIAVRVIGVEEAQLWTDINVKGWAFDHPELIEFLQQGSKLSFARRQTACFLAEFKGEPGAAGALFLHEGVALLAGAATIPELRRRGLQTALLQARLLYAFQHGCDLAMIVAEVGSNSQRNAEHQGFRIAYTRIKWRRNCPSPALPAI